jgi:hypothetical protein
MNAVGRLTGARTNGVWTFVRFVSSVLVTNVSHV